MVEIRDDAAPPFGWTFEVSIQRLGEDPGNRLLLMPYHVGIGDQTLASSALEKHLEKFDGTEIKPRSPISAVLAHAMKLSPNEIAQERFPGPNPSGAART